MDPALKNTSGLVIVEAVVAFVVLVVVIVVVVVERSRIGTVVDGFDAAASYVLVVRNTV